MKHKLLIGSLVFVLFLALGLGYAFLPYESKTHYNITFDIVKWIIIIMMGYFLIRGGVGITQSVVG